ASERVQMTVAAPSEQHHRTPEYRLVSQLTSGSVAVGVFLKRVQGESSEYDITEIAFELGDRITKGHPQARLRALRAVEGLADREEVRDVCTDCVSDPQALPQICRATAARVSRALHGANGHRPVAAPKQSMPDLLDLGGGDSLSEESVEAAVVDNAGGDDLLLLGEADFLDAPVNSNAKEVDLSGLNLGGSIAAGDKNRQLPPGYQTVGDNLLGEQSASGILPVQQASSLLPDLAVGSIQTNGAQQTHSAGGYTMGGHQLDDIFTEAAAKAAAQAAGGSCMDGKCSNFTSVGQQSGKSSAFSFIGSGVRR
ncbi:hypothetical protein Pmar_PMAR009657, partial [Perkinsus marinus ATCC 50983]